MQLNLQALEKKAVKAALDQEWDSAVSINEEILGKIPNDKNAKIRLGRAYLKTQKYAKAKKIYKEILEEDPINKIAQKNIILASEKKDDTYAGKEIGRNTRAFIKEPGTTTQVEFDVDKRRIGRLEIGQELELKINKTKISFCIPGDTSEIGNIQNEICKTAYDARQDGKVLSTKVLKVKEGSAVITLICKHPIFKSEKQQEKPFIKRDVLDEPDIDIPEMETSDSDSDME